MTINILSEIDIIKATGSGEYVLRRLIDHGMKSGHSIKLYNPKDRIDSDADIYILADLWNEFGKQNLQWFESSMIDGIIKTKKYITLSNAFVNVCALPYFPCSFQECGADSCEVYKRKLWNYPCKNNPLTKSLFACASGNVFVSPLHGDVCGKFLGFDIPNQFHLRPIVDTSLFYNLGIKEDNKLYKYVYAGTISHEKGYSNIVRHLKSLRVPPRDMFWFGNNLTGNIYLYGNYMGTARYEDMPLILNNAVHFIH